MWGYPREGDARAMPTPEAACVVAGAAGGALLRYGISEYGKARGSGPAAILLINVLGSFILGGCTSALPPTRATLMLGTGFCGSFTTFSTFSIDVMKFTQAGNLPMAAAYAVGTNVLSIGAAAAGLHLGAASPVVARLAAKLPAALRVPPRPVFPLPPPKL